MVLTKFLTCSVLALSFSLASAQAGAQVIDDKLPFDNLVQPSCGPGITTCDGGDVQEITVYEGIPTTTTLWSTVTAVKNHTTTVTNIIPSITTLYNSTRGICNILKTKTIKRNETVTVSRGTTSVLHRAVQTTTNVISVMTVTVDAMSACIINQVLAGPVIPPPGQNQTVTIQAGGVAGNAVNDMKVEAGHVDTPPAGDAQHVEQGTA